MDSFTVWFHELSHAVGVEAESREDAIIAARVYAAELVTDDYLTYFGDSRETPLAFTLMDIENNTVNRAIRSW